MRKASKILQELKASGWKPGPMSNDRLRKDCQAFAEFSEAAGCDTEGHASEALREDFTPGVTIGEGSGDYSIRDLFENLVVNKSDGEPVGHRFVEDYCMPGRESSLREAMEATDSSAFLGITGQLMVTMILAPYEKEEYMVRKMIPTWNSMLQQEKWIATTPPADPGKNQLLAQEQDALTYVSFGEQYIQSPLTLKRQKGIALTKEAIFYNRTGDITKQAEEVGDLLAYDEEIECIDAIIGSTTNGQLFYEKRLNDTGVVSINPYQAVNGTGANQLAGTTYSARPYAFVNDVPNNPITDVTAIETCDQYFSNIVDPNRGRPIVVGKPYVFACHTQRMKLMRVIEAESLYAATASGISTTGGFLTRGPNTLEKIGLTIDQLKTSRLLKQRLEVLLGGTGSYYSAQADQIWFYGDIAAAAKYVVNWPVTVVQAPFLSEAEFSQDIVMRWKASRKGTFAWYEPRQLLRNNYLSESSTPNF